MLNKIKIVFAFCVAMMFAGVTYAHHMAPNEMTDFITSQLEDVDSPHLLSSEDDPSLLDITIPGMDEVDYVIVVTDLTIEEALELIEDTQYLLSTDTTVEDFSWLISPEDDGEYTLTFYINYK